MQVSNSFHNATKLTELVATLKSMPPDSPSYSDIDSIHIRDYHICTVPASSIISTYELSYMHEAYRCMHMKFRIDVTKHDIVMQTCRRPEGLIMNPRIHYI